jgi:hypothetical protein
LRPDHVKEVYMKITKVEAIPFDIPVRLDVEPCKWASGGLDKAGHVLIRGSVEDGLVRYGKAMPRPGFYGESQRGIVVAADAAGIKNRAE